MPATAPKPVLLELLRCPEPHHAPLSFDRETNALTCSECAKVFRVEDGIPVMLLDSTVNGSAAHDSAAE
ncbi:Trm112 family protein [Glycomyces dulcitolivorans]|uniref:Trm112 family protein n=1 Tax=Glycomyces dulcitolivorans TaxID=2200759 RepID=UPI000DD3A669|nr:Trm112 family protein [Glycomyces dulcitolivorans]